MNAVAPGYFPDAVTAGEAGYAERVQSAKTTVPLGRVGRLREVGLLCTLPGRGRRLRLHDGSGRSTWTAASAAL